MGFKLADIEVLGLGVVQDDGGRGLLGVELELLAERDADPAGFEQRPEFGLVLERRVRSSTPGFGPMLKMGLHKFLLQIVFLVVTVYNKCPALGGFHV